MDHVEKEKEDAIVLAISMGDEKAFESFYFQHARDLYQFLWRKCGDGQLAEDFVQECFARIWRTRSSLDPFQSARAYLYKTARNILIDHFRKHGSEKQFVEVEESMASFESHEQGVIQRGEIKEALKGLTEMQYSVFSMSRFDGLSYKEMAEVLGLSIKTIEGHMSRALAYLRANLGHLLILMIIFSLL